MNDFTENNHARKRKAYELDQEEKQMTKNTNEDPECYKASEEEMKKRRIVRVVRNTDQPKEEAPRGKFIFNAPNKTTVPETSTEEIKNTQEVEKKIEVSPSSTSEQIKESSNVMNSAQSYSGSKTIIEGGVKVVKISLKSPAKQIEQIENVVQSSKKEVEKKEVTETKSEILTGNFNPTGKKFNNDINPFQSNSATTNTANTSSSNNFLANPSAPTIKNYNNPVQITSNPFLSTTFGSNSNTFTGSGFNPFLPKPTQPSINSNTFGGASSNPFQSLQQGTPFTNNSLAGKPMFNFNLNQAKENPNWNSDEEEGEDANPEEEIKIEAKEAGSAGKTNLPKSSAVKVVKIGLDDLSVYDFAEKKYKSKGKGEFSIELMKTEAGTVLAVCVYRNTAMVSLFSATIFKGATNFEAGSKNFKPFVVIQKLAGKNETSGKTENKCAKLLFSSEKDSKHFAEKFNESLQILEKNDLSLFPKEETSSK
jgi:hypothetical protein